MADAISDAAPPPAYLHLHESAVPVLARGASSGHKTNAYLDNILARRAALDAGADEAVLFTNSVAWPVRRQAMFCSNRQATHHPPLSEGALAGIVRARLLAIGDIDGISLKEGLIGRDLLSKADALFVTNSLYGVVPAGFDDQVGMAQKNRAAPYAKPCLNLTGFKGRDLVFRLQNLTPAIHAAFQVNMVTPMQLAAIGVFHIAWRAQRIAGAAHATLGFGVFRFGTAITRLLLISKCGALYATNAMA